MISDTIPVAAGRKLAWIKDAEDANDHDAASTMLRAAAPPPPAAINDDLVKVVDQGGLGSCTANATGQAMRAAEILALVEVAREDWATAGNDPATFDAIESTRQHNEQLDFWSRLFAYYLARSYTKDQHQDTGTQIRLIFTAVNKYGFVPESVWPYSDDTSPAAPAFKNPPANAYRLAYDARASAENVQRKVVDYARITSSGTQRIADIKAAIAQRHLVVFGTLVTEQFCGDPSASNGNAIPKPASTTKDIAGGHALCVGGYDADGAKIVNSWGTAWGGRGGLPAGWCKFAWEYMTWSETSDLWIVRRAPLLALAAA